MVCRAHLKRQVKDPVLRAKLTPTFRAGCKRLIIADDWYPALARPNVDVDHGRDHRDPARGRRHRRRHRARRRHAHPRHGLRDHADRRPAARPRRRLAGRALGRAPRGLPRHHGRGLPELLHARRAEHGDGPHLGAALRGGADRVRAAVPAPRRAQRRASDRGPRGAQHAFSESIREKLQGTVWLLGGCNSWYLNERGGTSVLWPGTTWEFNACLRQLDPSDYELDLAQQTGPPHDGPVSVTTSVRPA